MTRYEHGFMYKCAEAGLGIGEAMELMGKSAAIRIPASPNLWGRTSDYLMRFGRKIRPNRLKGTMIDRGAKRFVELLGGGNTQARRFYRETSALKDLIAHAQATGDVKTARRLMDQLGKVNSVVEKSRSGLFRRPVHSTAGESRAWFNLFDPFSGSLNRRQVANELNKVKWARRGGMAALAAPVAVPMAASVLGGGGGDGDAGVDYSFDENGNLGYSQYPQQQMYGNTAMYR